MRVPHQLLRDTVLLSRYQGSGSRGPVYTPEESVRASMQPTNRVVDDGRGQTLTVNTAMIVRPEVGPIRPESRVVWMGSQYRVVSAFPMPDSRRPTHWECTLERSSEA